MKEMKMLDLDRIDLGDLAMALDDHSYDHAWALDPETGDLWMRSEHEPGEIDELLAERGKSFDDLIWIEPAPSSEGYSEMEEFVREVRDPRAREQLERAIEGRGAFRRFKDTLFGFEDLREAWFQRKNVRDERRAIEWLRAKRLLDDAAADAAIVALPDPESELLGEPFDAFEIARDVARDLRELYGERLHDVILFGSWARGDAHRESDIDLLVVLDEVDSAWDEIKRMSEVLYRHSLANDTLVSGTVCSAADLAHDPQPLFAAVKDEGVPVS